MPTISVFLGVVIRMYYREHAPPHFHAYYQHYEARIAIETLEVLSGQLPRRAIAFVLEWAALHQQELRTNWTLVEQRRPLNAVEPLE